MHNEDKIKRNKEFWEVDKAVKRLVWRLAPNSKGEYSNFRVLEDDFNALKSILGSLDRDKKINVSNNVLLAKLYIYHLTMNIRYFGTTVLDEYPQKDLGRLLDLPLEKFTQAFYKDLIDNQLNKLVETDNENEQKEILKQYEDFKKTFTLEFVENKLFDMVNKALKRYS